ncbi:hypothetical protein ACFPRL_00965 [Pseudoclavibacter helvolus]
MEPFQMDLMHQVQPRRRSPGRFVAECSPLIASGVRCILGRWRPRSRR